MLSANATTDRKSEIHTEVRRPIETVMANVVWYVFGAIEVLIAIRFFLKLFGANAEAGFVKLVYGLSDIFMAPFVSVFNTEAVAKSTIEWSALVAIAVYALIAWGLVALIQALTPREHAETVERSVKNDDVRTP